MSVAGLIDVGQDLWGGYCPAMPPSQLPSGASPNCQDVIFPEGAVRSRPRLFSFFPPIAGNPTVNGLKTYAKNLTNTLLAWDSAGNLWQESAPSVLSLIASRPYAGLFYNSVTLFGREYQTFFNSLGGFDIPRQFDGTNWDRVSQTGPGVAPTAADSATAGNIAAGTRQVTVAFITRQGLITCPAVPSTWTAAGSKQVSLTNIAIGPPNIVARLILFTGAITAPAKTGPFFSLPTGTAQLATPTAMLINDNVTTSLTVDFTDSILLAGFSGNYLFGQVELGACAAVGQYNSRTVFVQERNKVKADGGGGGFINLGFDGGFGAAGMSPVQGNSGPNFGSAAASVTFPGATVPWTNLAGAEGNNPGSPATAVNIPASGGESTNLVVTGFGFNIPSNATVVGIVVKVDAKGAHAGVLSDNGVFLVKANAIVGQDHSNGLLLGTAFATQTYGSSTDLWSTSLAPADVNAAGFGASYAMTNTASATAYTGSATNITITVYYTTPATGGTVGPWGWTQTANYAGGASALTVNQSADWGDAFAITGDGATAIRGQITQPATLDYLLNSIIARATAYRVRARCASAGGLAQGTLHINLQSTTGNFTTPGLSVQAGALGASYKEFDAILTTAIASPPADMVLQVYADGTPTNGGVFLVDSIEIYPASTPFNYSLARLSHANNPESFDGVTGVVQILDAGNKGAQALRATWKIRTNLYLAKDHYLGYVTDDGANEPASWSVTEVSNTIGCCGPNAWDGTEEWVVVSERSGAYITTGSDPVKIMQEIQEDVSGTGKPNWNATNWNAGYTAWTRIDTIAKRIIVGLPTNGAGTPNQVFQMDYKFSPTGESIEGAQSPTYSAFTGRILVHGSARKWAPWTMTANCCALVERPDGTAQVFFGNGVGNGKIYEAIDAAVQGTDDGVPVNDFYTTYGNPSKNDEEGLQLRAHRKICEYLTGVVTGNGLLSIQAISPYRTTPVRAVTLSATEGPDFERKVSIHGERIFWQVGTNAAGNWFQLERLIPCLKPDPVTLVRGLSA